MKGLLILWLHFLSSILIFSIALPLNNVSRTLGATVRRGNILIKAGAKTREIYVLDEDDEKHLIWDWDTLVSLGYSLADVTYCNIDAYNTGNFCNLDLITLVTVKSSRNANHIIRHD